MFDQIEANNRFRGPLLSYSLHLFLAFPLAVFVGEAAESATRFVYAGNNVIAAIGPVATIIAGLMGFFVNFRRRNRSASFVFVLPLFLFLDSWYELATGWDPSWSSQSHSEYLMNNLFGPSCGSTECLYTIGTRLFPASVAYSLGAVLARQRQGSRDAGESFGRPEV